MFLFGDVGRRLIWRNAVSTPPPSLDCVCDPVACRLIRTVAERRRAGGEGDMEEREYEDGGEVGVVDSALLKSVFLLSTFCQRGSASVALLTNIFYVV